MVLKEIIRAYLDLVLLILIMRNTFFIHTVQFAWL